MKPFLVVILALSVSVTASCQTEEDLIGAVRATETAFAQTMADRDLDAFSDFVSPEAVFLGNRVLRGRGAIAEGWSRFFQDTEAPFSWKPETVEVLDSGTLAFSSGPVLDPAGTRIGTFNSVWRRESNGEWKVVFDKGCPPCSQ